MGTSNQSARSTSMIDIGQFDTSSQTLGIDSLSTFRRDALVILLCVILLCAKTCAVVPKMVTPTREGFVRHGRDHLPSHRGHYSGCFAPSLAPLTAPVVVSFVLCQAFFVPCFVLE